MARAIEAFFAAHPSDGPAKGPDAPDGAALKANKATATGPLPKGQKKFGHSFISDFRMAGAPAGCYRRALFRTAHLSRPMRVTEISPPISIDAMPKVVHADVRPVHWFRFRDRRPAFRYRRPGRRRHALCLFQGLAGLHAAQELRTAGHDPRPCRRRLAARGIFARATPVSSVHRHSAAGEAGFHLRRGQEFLQPRRHRSRRHLARGVVLAQGNERCRAPRPSPSRSRRTFS